MSLHEALTEQLLTIIDTQFDHEIGHQPACHLSQADAANRMRGSSRPWPAAARSS